MRTIKLTSQFKKDLRKIGKQPLRSRGIDVLDNIILPKLLAGELLAKKIQSS